MKKFYSLFCKGKGGPINKCEKYIFDKLRFIEQVIIQRKYYSVTQGTNLSHMNLEPLYLFFGVSVSENSRITHLSMESQVRHLRLINVPCKESV